MSGGNGDEDLRNRISATMRALELSRSELAKKMSEAKKLINEQLEMNSTSSLQWKATQARIETLNDDMAKIKSSIEKKEDWLNQNSNGPQKPPKPNIMLEGADEISKLRKAVRDFESDGVPDKIEWHKKEIADISEKINLLKAHIKLMENQNTPGEVKALTKQLESLNRLKDGHCSKLESFAAEPPPIPPRPTQESIMKFENSQQSVAPPNPVTPSASASPRSQSPGAGKDTAADQEPAANKRNNKP